MASEYALRDHPGRRPPLPVRSRGRLASHGVLLDIDAADLPGLIRSCAWWFDDGGKLQIAAAGQAPFVEFRKRCWKTRPDLFRFRYRNADATRRHFVQVQEILQASHHHYEVTRTKKLKRPRALVVDLAPYDSLVGITAMKLTRDALEVSDPGASKFDFRCAARLRPDLGEPQVGYLGIPPERMAWVSKSTAYRAGYRAGSFVRWLKG